MTHSRDRNSAIDTIVSCYGRQSRLAKVSISLLCESFEANSPSQGDCVDSVIAEWRRAIFSINSDEASSKSGFDVGPAWQLGAIEKDWRQHWKNEPFGSIRSLEYLLLAVQVYYALALRWILYRYIFHSLSRLSSPTQTVTSINNLDDFCTLLNDQWFSVIGWRGFQLPLFSSLIGNGETLAKLCDCFVTSKDVEPSSEAFERFVEELASKMSDEPGGLESHEAIASDLFRALYQDLIPKKVRQRLGEFYTPRWLVEFTIQQSVGDDPLESKRFLDPACGSGSFLVVALDRWRRSTNSVIGFCDRKGAKLASPNNSELLIDVPIVGIDANPVAVMSARANYVLRVVDRLPKGGQQWQVPVYYGDSILDCEQADPSISSTSRETGSLQLGQFDFVAGNPPWVGWESLSTSYRQRTESLWRKYGLFAHSGMDTILGKGRKDLSMLMSYAVSDHYLKEHGKLSFVITQSAFFNQGIGRGFRNLRLGETTRQHLRIDSLHDFSQIQPFESAVTSSIVFCWTKGSKTTFPIKMTTWSQLDRKTIRPTDQWLDVREDITTNDLNVGPLSKNDPADAWIRYIGTDVERVRALSRPSTYRAYEGVNTGGANGVYWLQPTELNSNDSNRDDLVWVQNQPSKGKRSLETRTAQLERELLFPIIRGTQLKRWTCHCDTFVLLAQDPKSRRGVDEEEMRSQFPNCLRYLQHFEGHLRQRAAFRRYFSRSSSSRESSPFWSMFNVGTYTMAPYKVAWHRMIAPIQATVFGTIQGRPILPQETHAFIPFDDFDEAVYVAAMINSTAFSSIAEATNPAGGKSFGSPHILKRVYVPTFDPTDANHIAVVNIARQLPRLTGHTQIVGSAGSDNDGIDRQRLQEDVSRLATIVYESELEST